MSRINLSDRIKEGLLLLDGAMGTQLFARGVKAGRCNEYLNIESPDTVLDVHRAYIAAGSDAIITNTFGANTITLARHGLSAKADRINTAGAEIARKAAGEENYVLGDIGPCGDFLAPLGTLKPEDLQEAFATQAKTLADAGVDGFIIETMTALDEIEVAIKAVKSVCVLPILASLSYDPAGAEFRTMMGVDPATAAGRLIPLGIDAIGFNCGTLTLEQYVGLAQNYAAAVEGKVALLAEPNAGKPELIDCRAVYNVTGAEFAQAAEKIHSAGARIIGGCCGTAPEHIKALAEKLKK